MAHAGTDCAQRVSRRDGIGSWPSSLRSSRLRSPNRREARVGTPRSCARPSRAGSAQRSTRLASQARSRSLPPAAPRCCVHSMPLATSCGRCRCARLRTPRRGSWCREIVLTRPRAQGTKALPSGAGPSRRQRRGERQARPGAGIGTSDHLVRGARAAGTDRRDGRHSARCLVLAIMLPIVSR